MPPRDEPSLLLANQIGIEGAKSLHDQLCNEFVDDLQHGEGAPILQPPLVGFLRNQFKDPCHNLV